MRHISVASAPGKTILFGEHSVVYDEPAIAGAVNKRATVSIRRSNNNYSTLKSNDLGFEVKMDTRRGTYTLVRGKPGIIRYILNAMGKFHDHSNIDMSLSLNLPIGSGLGSSAAVTVATIAALHHFHGVEFNKETLAHEAHGVEEEVQGIASPLDTLISTYGGLIYLSREKRIVRFDSHLDAPLTYPELVNPIISTMGKIANEARVAIIKNDVERIAELMNLNQGLLDSLGVNTYELSRMIYTARDNGALASKITGSGGGGSIISLCREDNVDEVADAINVEDKTIKVKFSKDGVLINRRAPPLP